MKILKKYLFYTIAIVHAPWTLIRVFVALIVVIDAWCDKVIYGAIKEYMED